MRVSKLIIVIGIALVGITQKNLAQTPVKEKNRIEQKEISPVKETKIKQETYTETTVPRQAEFTPERQPEIKNETPAENNANTPIIEQQREEPVEKTEWVKTQPKSEAKTAEQQSAQPVFKMPVFNGQVKPVEGKRGAVKP